MNFRNLRKCKQIKEQIGRNKYPNNYSKFLKFPTFFQDFPKFSSFKSAVHYHLNPPSGLTLKKNLTLQKNSFL